MRAVEAIRDRSAIRNLSDTHKVKVVVHADQAWANEVWIPLLITAGVKRFALVTAAAGLGKATVGDVIRLVDNRGVLIQGFASLETAHEGLAEASSV